MERFGINTKKSFGVSVSEIRKLAKETGKNHRLARRLWKTGIREARILASLIDDSKAVTEKQMEDWVRGFDSWDVCDLTCSNLFDKTPYAYKKAREWSRRGEEFVKRAGFVLMAVLSVHDKNAENKKFEQFLPLIKKHSSDERNFVKKAVNWSLRQIGKRNLSLNKKAIQVAKEIAEIDSKSARWIARDTLRELTSERVKKRFN
ncbi:MAG: DNA alkylation repair protein [Candidatus Nealsonbacteria bacterium]|nr:DNA alkylation repair protein [Candidatus Nealsonbacteria bacterium]